MTAAPDAEEAAGEEPESGPDLEHAAARSRDRPRRGSATARRHRPGSSATARGGRAGRPRAACRERRSGRSRRSARAGRRPGAPSALGERERWPRVEVEARPLARLEPTGAGRADHRAVVRAQRRAAARSAGCADSSASSARRSRRQLLAATPPPSTIDRAPELLGRTNGLRREDVDDRILEPPRQFGGRRLAQGRLGVIGCDALRRRGRRPRSAERPS